jgi:far upstream element-binding protein
MRIPINRCGVIIGRGGETIKRLSEQYGVKMVVQPAEDPNAVDRPLRMTGDSDKIARAKEGILDLISPKTRTTVGEYGTKSSEPVSIIRVPGEKAGVVIGKG